MEQELKRGRVKRSLRAWLGTPWAWPRDAELAARARGFGLREPDPPEPGETLFVTVSPCGRQACIWRTSCAERDSGEQMLVGEARESAWRATKLVLRDLPLLARPPATDHRPPRLERMLREGPDGNAAPPELSARVVDGPSAGLSLCLAQASLLLDLPVPSDLVASATVDDSGRLGPVGGLQEKLAVVSRRALGVSRILVAKEQADEAKRLVKGTRLTVESRKTLGEAIELVFPDVLTVMRHRWAEPAARREAAELLHRVALFDHPRLLTWAAVRKSARFLLGHEDLTDDLRDRCRLTEAIAARHEGESAPIPWPEDEVLRRMRRPLRMRLLAHVVQSAADDSDARALDYAGRAECWLADPLEWAEGDLALQGARGRALASAGHYDDACNLLDAVVCAWLELGQAHQASFAACELLRLLGLARNRDALDIGSRRAVEILSDLRTSDKSRTFLRLALGRAWIQAGDEQTGLEWLADDPVWAKAPDHVCGSRLRWRAHALRGREGEQAWEALRQEGLGMHVALAEIDRAVLRGDEAAAQAALDRALKIEKKKAHQEVSRLVARFGRRPAEISAHYRYG